MSFSDLTHEEKKQLLVNSSDSVFAQLCSTSKEMKRYCYEYPNSESVFEGRSRRWFTDDIIAYKEASSKAMTWKEFYQRITYLFNNKDKYDIIFRLVNNGKLMELKILGTILTPDHVSQAVIHDHLDILKYAIEQGFDMNDVDNQNVLKLYACRYGKVNILNFLETYGIVPNRDDIGEAIANHYWNVLYWGEERGIIPNENGAVDAVIHGHYDILLWLYDSYDILPNEDLMNESLQEHQIDLYYVWPEIEEFLTELNVYVREIQENSVTNSEDYDSDTSNVSDSDNASE